ncbi:MAG: OB-fold nucleic acid binding domain-containing protein, partial [Eubacteriales bacterium]|nr:OB-fold nucleic acid binding domain-containing protein [Eubacteriales bacterium]
LIHGEENNGIRDGMNVTVAGIISARKTLITKKNNMMAFLQLEDLYGSIEVIVFPNIYEGYRDLIDEDAVVVIKGTVNYKEEEEPKILANKIFAIDDYNEDSLRGAIKLRVPKDRDAKRLLQEIKMILSQYPGDTPVKIYLASTGKRLRTDTDLWVTPSSEFFSIMENLIGKENVK